MPHSQRTFKSVGRRLGAVALVAAATLVALAMAGEIGARLAMPEGSGTSCYLADRHLGHRNTPNCSTWEQGAEGPRVEYRYNGCGLRGLSPCGPKPRDAVRIAVVGNSFGQGAGVEIEDSFAERAAARLRKTCRPRVDLQNFSGIGYSLLNLYERFPDALNSKPDVLVFVLMPNDVAVPLSDKDFAERDDPNVARKSSVLDTEPPSKSILAIVRGLVRTSRLGVLVQHFMFRDDQFYEKTYLMRGEFSDFLRSRTTPAWRERYRKADAMIASMAGRANEAGVKLVLVTLPQRVQAAMLDTPQDVPAGYDPHTFSEELAAIAHAHGVSAIDGLALVESDHNSADFFYPVDGHLSVEGHHLVGDRLGGRLQTEMARDHLCEEGGDARR